MKILALLQTLFLAALPAVQYSYLESDVAFYTFDGVDYNIVFYLPATYFVALEEEGEEYDRVTYLDMSGYIAHGAAAKVDYEPVTKYATGGKIALKKGIASVYLYAEPDCATVLASVTATDTLFLYGKSPLTDVYYCRFKGTAGTLRGYVGIEGVTVTLPAENIIESVTPPEDLDPDPNDPNDPGDENIYKTNLPLPVEIILIIALAVPAFLLVFLLTRKKTK